MADPWRSSDSKGTVLTLHPWRIFNPVRTTNALLVVCLNVGVDPLAFRKPRNCYWMEYWFEPKVEAQRSLKEVVRRLQAQYERWKPRARYRVAPDLAINDARRPCRSVRKNSKHERMLFHYNGHGVPKPTPNGEIGVFNNTSRSLSLSFYGSIRPNRRPSHIRVRL